MPDPTVNLSIPEPPVSVSLPAPPSSVSLTAPPTSVSAPVPPMSVSAPLDPVSVAAVPVFVTLNPFPDVTAERLTASPLVVILAVPLFTLADVAVHAVLIATVAVAPEATVKISAPPLPRSLIVSAPDPTVNVSIPSPPVSVSLPRPPSRTLAKLLPVNVSLKALPVKFSIVARVSDPAPPVAWAVNVARLTVTADAALA